jgi:GT2 family glycosyltransferase
VKLSVIIVNYNVKHFVEQCLHSVYNALKNIDAEVFVVDNNSVDGSCPMIKEKFPQVILIENKINQGFSKANNQAITLSKGEYVLLLNPDTVVQEDTFKKCIDFMDQHPDAGALGVKMIDGKGNFLPESKRALPTPEVAFYKIFGLSTLFPRSKKFGKYHLSYLDKNKNHEVDILSGAYMFMRKAALDKSGLLDEDFFMYGEDIDLSYRIIKAGYKNYYFAETTIIHYKGESTKKSSVNYVLVFYNAMQIFARKHFSQKNAWLFSFLINIAIYLRALLSIIKRFLKKTYIPFIDVVVIYSGYLVIKHWWETLVFNQSQYPKEYLLFVVPVYVLVWIIALILTGAYEKPIKLLNIVKGILSGTLAILAIYALLPLELRYSRALILIGTIWCIISLTGYRAFLHIFNFSDFKLKTLNKKRIILVGDESETQRVSQILLQTHINPEILGFVNNDESSSKLYIGKTEQLEDIINIYNADEIIFCARNIATQDIISQMLKLSHIDIEYKIAPPESLSIIGSSSINTAGDLYLINLNTINKPENKRNKRIIDIIASLLFLIFSPIIILYIKNKKKTLLNILKILAGKKTWVGYYIAPGVKTNDLPSLKPSVLTPIDGLSNKNLSADLKEKLNYLYAKDYKFTNDINIIIKGMLYIGR